MSSYSEILFFWFLKPSHSEAYIKERLPLWFGGGGHNDEVVRARFLEDVERAREGALDGWADVAKGRLALILLHDQFPRMLFRGTGEAFAQDPQAVALCLEGLEREQDKRLEPIERLFFYLPLEHSEALAHQELCIELLTALADDVAPEDRERFESFIDYGERHREIIARFGRFPHRNAALGRENTEEEEVYLRQPGAGF